MIIYIAGPLFTEADQAQRRLEGKLISEIISDNDLNARLISPIDLNPDDDTPYASKDIFLNDYRYIKEVNAIFYDLATEDSGTCTCLGVAIKRYMDHEDVRIYPVFSDSRLKRNGLKGLESSLGYNSFVVGSLKANDIEIFYSFKDALTKFKKDFKLK